MDHKSHEVDCYPLKIKTFLYREIIIKLYYFTSIIQKAH